LLLQPRNFTFKKKQKNRRFLSFNNLHNNLNFGGAGLLLLRAIQLTAKQLSRFKLFLKRAMKKADRTRRFV
jgi:ribosomal protein L16/L10AE